MIWGAMQVVYGFFRDAMTSDPTRTTYVYGTLPKDVPQVATQRPRLHDYRHPVRGWGHDLTWTPDDIDPNVLHATGWGSRRAHPPPPGAGLLVDGYTTIAAGDYFVISLRATPDIRYFYRVETITYYRDPRDMFRADLRWVKDPPEEVRVLLGA